MSANLHEDHSFLGRLTEIISSHLDKESFSVEELSEKMDLSRSMLHRRLKKITGKSASELITEMRLEKAKELLENSDYTSAEIAYKTGFNSPSYFNKVFKKVYQVSPGDLRKGKKAAVLQTTGKGKSFSFKSKSTVFITIVVMLGVALFWLGTHYTKAKTNRSEISIAILPFDNLSDVQNTQYFADGVVEDLLNRLATIKDIKVISRTSSEMFREKGEKTVPEIGKLLGASHVVEGSVQRVEDNIRISIQLIDTKTDNHVLSKQYDRNLSDFFKIQSEIAGEIVSELVPVLSNQEFEKLHHDYTQNPVAFEFYQLGRFHSGKRTEEGFRKGIEYYEKAIETDVNYGLAYAGLADNYYLMMFVVPSDKSEVRKKSLEMAEKALEIDPNLAEAHAVKGSVYTYIDWNWEAAEKELLKAIELNPNYSTAHHYYAEYLKIMGRFEEAREHLNTALKLNPFSFVIRYVSSRLYYDSEQFEEALEEIKMCEDLDKDHIWVRNLKFDIYLALKNDSGLLDFMKRTSDQVGLWTTEQVDSVYHNGGIDEIKRWVTSQQNFDPECTKAIFYAMLGDYENAMDMLELAYETGYLAPSSTTYLEYKPLRTDPRFMAIREKMGLPQLEP